MRSPMALWLSATLLLVTLVGCSNDGGATGTEHPNIVKTREQFQKDPQTLSLGTESTSEDPGKNESPDAGTATPPTTP
jgi:hypothetical protein